MVQVHNLIEENMSLAVKNMTAQNPNFKVNLEKDWDKQVKKSLIAPQGISRVILYLLSNSFYTVDEKLNKGKIKDFEPTVKISTILETDNNNILIKIWDNGMGISEENLNKIFDPFFTTKPTGRGNTGLGLSICYDLAAKQHGGDLTVNSKVDEFTEFTIKIPLKTKK
jgi:signal transduction histidine kinase